MVKINLEIVEYIENSELDDRIKNLILNIIFYEIRHPTQKRYKENYKVIIENCMRSD